MAERSHERTGIAFSVRQFYPVVNDDPGNAVLKSGEIPGGTRLIQWFCGWTLDRLFEVESLTVWGKRGIGLPNSHNKAAFLESGAAIFFYCILGKNCYL